MTRTTRDLIAAARYLLENNDITFPALRFLYEAQADQEDAKGRHAEAWNIREAVSILQNEVAGTGAQAYHSAHD